MNEEEYTMNFKDEDFSTEKVCDLVWNKFEIDIYCEEYPEGTFKYITIEGQKTPINTEIANFILSFYDGCNFFRTGNKLTIQTKK